MAWSVLLHALLLAAFAPSLAPSAREVPPERILQGRLTRAAVQEIPTATPRLAQAVPARPASPSLQTAAQQPTLAAPTAVAPAPSIAAPAVGGIAAARESAAPANVAVSHVDNDAAPDAAGLRQYRLALAGEARKYKRYPEAARRAGWHGTAEVRIEVGGPGREADLAKSSGHTALDQAAVEMLRLAVARTALPESLRGRQFSVLLPVVFEVEE